MSQPYSQAGSQPTAARTTNTGTPRPAATTKASDLSPSASRIEQRMADRKAERERQAEANRQRYPQTAAAVNLIRSRFKGAQVLGFEEAGTAWGEYDLWERAARVGLGWKVPPKGPGISRGKSRSLSANPAGDR